MTLFIFTLIAGGIVLYLNFKLWKEKQRDTESLISLITAFCSLILVLLSFLKEKSDRKQDEFEKKVLRDSLFIQNKKLEATVRVSTSLLQDTLQKQIEGLRFVKDSLERKIFRLSPSQLFIEDEIVLDTNITVGALTPTDIDFHYGDKVEIHASGSMTLGFYAGPSEPNGIEKPFISSYSIVRNYKHGCLMYKTSPDSAWIYAGFETKFIATSTGSLTFEINDRRQKDNAGNYLVNVIISR